MKQINFAYSNFRTACGLWISRNAYPVWTTNSVTHCSAPWRPTRDLCWDTAWRRGTLRLESTLGCNIQANSSVWLWPRPTSTQRSYHPTFLSYLLHSYTLSPLTKPSLLPLVLPQWQRALIFFVTHRIFYKSHVWNSIYAHQMTRCNTVAEALTDNNRVQLCPWLRLTGHTAAKPSQPGQIRGPKRQEPPPRTPRPHKRSDPC